MTANNVVCQAHVPAGVPWRSLLLSLGHSCHENLVDNGTVTVMPVPAGRWKATPVAVKIIEHYSSREGVGSSKGNRISAGREMLFATSISHPNLVSCQQWAPCLCL
jgi:hypothetical protein